MLKLRCKKPKSFFLDRQTGETPFDAPDLGEVVRVLHAYEGRFYPGEIFYELRGYVGYFHSIYFEPLIVSPSEKETSIATS